MLTLYIEAPFAVCRTFTAGWYRPTATFLTPSMVYGLLLNLAGIESRLREEDENHPGTVPASLSRTDLPSVRLALGAAGGRLGRQSWCDIPDEADRFPRVQSLFQQLHNYPVGSSGGDRASTTFGNKYNITPVRREILVGIRALVAVDGSTEFTQAVIDGLQGGQPPSRYGIPFLGDNAFIPDRIESLETVQPAHWYEQITPDQPVIRPRTTRLSIWIDRADMSRTRSALFAPSALVKEIPPHAWIDIQPPQGN